MDKIIIDGGKKLKGRVGISGSKNSALPILFAALLTDDPVTINNVPTLADINATLSFLNFVGKKAQKKDSTVKMAASDAYRYIAPYDLVRKMRASVLIMGPLLARLGKVDVSLPGGCAIGARPIDIHLKAFKKLGAEIDLSGGYVRLSAKNGLKGADIKLRFPSVGATENIMLSAVLAKGRTRIINAAKEPEIGDLAIFLNKMGAKVGGGGSKTITIDGVDKLHGAVHAVIPDRIEAATYLIAAAITKGDIVLENVEADHIRAVIDKLKAAGMDIKEGESTIHIKHKRQLKPQSISTDVYPKFPTDVQAQWTALMSLVEGKSSVKENVFENRFMHIPELQRFGADLTIKGKTVGIKGVKKLSGAPVMVSDLRAGAALVLAGLAAEGDSVIDRIYHLDRGYELLEHKLKKLGADIKRIK
ncbi:MAG: UDP-N-acetylglucosamine 1-carboxyvinyltransferase [Elusimicrobiota bacterium]|jgi:UDP-N-acetylglucosamine 1-carboxyvinyltransferase|nr:UDP-N-acetylglucosamine 1-carboxyvinyltransferase [Elusimicrobiota bacterium]